MRVVVELEEGGVGAGRVASDCDVVGITAEMSNIGSCPFQGRSLVPEAIVARLRVLGQFGESRTSQESQ